MSKKPDFTVYHTREYTNGNGEVKTFYTAVGSAWRVKDGGMSVELPPGLSLSGRFVILAKKDRAEDGAQHTDGPADEIPL